MDGCGRALPHYPPHSDYVSRDLARRLGRGGAPTGARSDPLQTVLQRHPAVGDAATRAGGRYSYRGRVPGEVATGQMCVDGEGPSRQELVIQQSRKSAPGGLAFGCVSLPLTDY